MKSKSYWERFRGERVSRRRLLGAVGTGTAGVALVAACGGGGGGGGITATATVAAPGATATPSFGAPVRGGTYIVTSTVDWGTIDPVTSVAFGPFIFPRLYNVLVERSRRDPNFVIGIGALFPEIEAMIAATKATTDPEEQIALVHDVQRAIYEAGPAYLPIMTWNAFTLRQASVKNLPRG
ncbi:MAG: hypothetical protein IH958_03455, partial [Chloroflexi bacterium]|nr:hypothetical protein [Chloroflexota bacterium]